MQHVGALSIGNNDMASTTILPISMKTDCVKRYNITEREKDYTYIILTSISILHQVFNSMDDLLFL
jgi:hypothetical protein